MNTSTTRIIRSFLFICALLVMLVPACGGDGGHGVHQDTEEPLSESAAFVEKHEYDYGMNGFIEETAYTYFSNSGKRLWSEYDNNNDGVIEDVLYFKRDGSGRQTSLEYDDNNDQSIDRVDNFSYDENGRLASIECDYENDGDTDVRVTCTYDVDGREAGKDFDTYCDGSIDYSLRYTYNDQSQCIEAACYSTDADDPDWQIFYAYGTTGYILMEAHDTDGDEDIDMLVYYTRRVL